MLILLLIVAQMYITALLQITIMLEELGVEYDAWRISIGGDQFGSGFVKLNPNSKIPAMYDYGSKEEPIRVFESGSILMYLSEKFNGQFMPKDLRGRTECINWLMWQMGSAPYIGGGSVFRNEKSCHEMGPSNGKA